MTIRPKFKFFRLLRNKEIVEFADKLEEGVLHDDVEHSDLWDEREPILRDPSNSHLG